MDESVFGFAAALAVLITGASQSRQHGTDISKNHKKTVKNGQARTRESEEYKKKPKNQSRSQKSQASVKSSQRKVNSWSTEEVDINKKTENQAKMTKLSMEWKRLCKIKAKVQKCQSQSQYRRISSQTGAGTDMKTVKTKWALNQLQQPICVQLTKTVKTLKAQS
ncbi:hypothetical protein Tco_1112214 [Tanacetum coccineum]|uniref:Uncharacterized protein n=1 Tax=Tanacetum coccineum TaxID=301880 RepID=A0ABQ5IPA2_9ASTR